MGLWSKGIERSRTNEIRLEDNPRCWMKYGDHIIPLEHWPELKSENGYIPIHASISYVWHSIRIVPKRLSDVQMLTKEVLYWNSISKKPDTVQDCVVYDNHLKLVFHNFNPCAMSGGDIFCNVDFCDYGTVE